MNITDSERKIMMVLWQRHPLTADEIIRELAETNQWRAGTVKSLINRLLKKQAIAATPDGRRYLYSPLLSRQDCLADDSHRFLKRWFDGRLAPLVAHFTSNRDLSEDDKRQLRELLEELEDDD